MLGAICLAVVTFAHALIAVLSIAQPAAGLPPQPKVHPAGIPANFVRISPCIATMGEHWADPKTMPTGTIYGVWRGKPVFTERMVTVKDLVKGTSFDNMRALPGYRIDHVDVDFEPHGHPGLLVPHYDVHAYYVSPAVEARICPNGVRDPAVKQVEL